MVWFSDRAAMAAAWPWAGFTPAQDMARFSLMPAAPFLAGHFPGRPILPGVAIIDAALMACRAAADNDRLRVGGVSDARFFSTVQPGDELTLHATPAGDAAWRVAAHASGGLCARMTLHVTERELAPRRTALHELPLFDLGPADIAQRLPQRAPMLMLEGAVRRADGSWDVHGRPHLPPAAHGGLFDYPKSLICEGFFQAAGIALESALPEDAVLLLGGIGRVEFVAAPRASEGVHHIVTRCRKLGQAALVAGQTRSLDDGLVSQYADVLVAVRSADTISHKA